MPPRPAIAVVIPARMASVRLPGKPLADLGGRPMIVRVWERARQAVDTVVVATDSPEIAAAVRAAGGDAVLTGECANGTIRCAAAGVDADVLVNVQGDEPFVDPAHIRAVGEAVGAAPIATAAAPLVGDPAEPARVKVVTDDDGHALYFSRAPIPSGGPWRLHVGLYAYAPATLRALVRLPPSPLEASERLEQLRWLAAGYRIQVVDVDAASGGVDTPADLKAAQTRFLEGFP